MSVEAKCPVCGSIVDTRESHCERCGFKFVGATQSFAPINIKNSSSPSPTEGVSDLVLVVGSGSHDPEVFYIDRPSISLGRDPGCDIFLNDMTVSRKHALITSEDGKVTVKDQGSLNGTWVDGEIVESAELHVGSLLQIGIFDISIEKDTDQCGRER